MIELLRTLGLGEENPPARNSREFLQTRPVIQEDFWSHDNRVVAALEERIEKPFRAALRLAIGCQHRIVVAPKDR